MEQHWNHHLCARPRTCMHWEQFTEEFKSNLASYNVPLRPHFSVPFLSTFQCPSLAETKPFSVLWEHAIRCVCLDNASCGRTINDKKWRKCLLLGARVVSNVSSSDTIFKLANKQVAIEVLNTARLRCDAFLFSNIKEFDSVHLRPFTDWEHICHEICTAASLPMHVHWSCYG